jgi:hypothetical protein
LAVDFHNISGRKRQSKRGPKWIAIFYLSDNKGCVFLK